MGVLLPTKEPLLILLVMDPLLLCTPYVAPSASPMLQRLHSLCCTVRITYAATSTSPMLHRLHHLCCNVCITHVEPSASPMLQRLQHPCCTLSIPPLAAPIPKHESMGTLLDSAKQRLSHSAPQLFHVVVIHRQPQCQAATVPSSHNSKKPQCQAATEPSSDRAKQPQ